MPPQPAPLPAPLPANDTLYLQIAEGIAQPIRAGTLARGERIPSVRALARQQGVPGLRVDGAGVGDDLLAKGGGGLRQGERRSGRCQIIGGRRENQGCAGARVWRAAPGRSDMPVRRQM